MNWKKRRSFIHVAGDYSSLKAIFMDIDDMYPASISMKIPQFESHYWARKTTLDTMGRNWGSPETPWGITIPYRIEDLKGGPLLGFHYAERRQSLGQKMFNFFPSGIRRGVTNFWPIFFYNFYNIHAPQKLASLGILGAQLKASPQTERTFYRIMIPRGLRGLSNSPPRGMSLSRISPVPNINTIIGLDSIL